MKLVYCFSKKLSFSEEQYNISLELLKKSVELSSKFYSVKIFTDNSTLQDIVPIDAEIVNLGELDLIFIDDFKVYILDLLTKNELFIDSDVLIYNPLSVDFSKDLVFDFIDSARSSWYSEGFNKLTNTSIRSFLDQIGKPTIVPNLGFLKINNSLLLKNYKDTYSKLRLLMLTEAKDLKPVSQFSIILGQYLLGVVFNKENYSYFSIRQANDKSTYKHLSGPVKHRVSQLI